MAQTTKPIILNETGLAIVEAINNLDGGSNAVHYTADTGKTTAEKLVARTNIGAGDEFVSNKVTSVSASSTDTEYPSAKCLYTMVGNIESLLDALL